MKDDPKLVVFWTKFWSSYLGTPEAMSSGNNLHLPKDRFVVADLVLAFDPDGTSHEVTVAKDRYLGRVGKRIVLSPVEWDLVTYSGERSTEDIDRAYGLCEMSCYVRKETP